LTPGRHKNPFITPLVAVIVIVDDAILSALDLGWVTIVIIILVRGFTLFKYQYSRVTAFHYNPDGPGRKRFVMG
jgi:uncharacterized membrane protein